MVVPFKVGRECVKMSPTPSVTTRGAKSLAASVQQGRTKFVSFAHSRAALEAPVDNNVTPGWLSPPPCLVILFHLGHTVTRVSTIVEILNI